MKTDEVLVKKFGSPLYVAVIEWLPSTTIVVEQVARLAVTGIAATAIGTLDCLRTAAAAGKNLVITREPIFWTDNDNLNRMEGNAEFKAKRDFIREHRT